VQYSKNAFEHKLCMANMRTILAGYQFTDKGTPWSRWAKLIPWIQRDVGDPRTQNESQTKPRTTNVFRRWMAERMARNKSQNKHNMNEPFNILVVTNSRWQATQWVEVDFSFVAIVGPTRVSGFGIRGLG